MENRMAIFEWFFIGIFFLNKNILYGRKSTTSYLKFYFILLYLKVIRYTVDFIFF